MLSSSHLTNFDAFFFLEAEYCRKKELRKTASFPPGERGCLHLILSLMWLAVLASIGISKLFISAFTGLREPGSSLVLPEKYRVASKTSSSPEFFWRWECENEDIGVLESLHGSHRNWAFKRPQ